MKYDKEKIEVLRKKYPRGTRIRLIEMKDEWMQKMCREHNIRFEGTLGTVQMVDDAGTIHMHWDIGSSLGLIPDEDVFEVVEDVEKM